MKMTNGDYKLLKAKIVSHLATLTPRELSSFKTGETTFLGFCWKCFWDSGSGEYLDSFYKYLNDEHINTALKKIILNYGR